MDPIENHENVENHECPRFGSFVTRNGPNTGSTKMRNVFPVNFVQSILRSSAEAGPDNEQSWGKNALVLFKEIFCFFKIFRLWGGVGWTRR